MRFWFVPVLLLLAGCQMSLGPFGQEREPNYKKILSEYLRDAFKDTSALRNVSATRAYPMPGPAGQVWQVCLRAEPRDALTGQYGTAQTYAILIEADKVTDRRRATQDDRCEDKTYEPL